MQPQKIKLIKNKKLFVKWNNDEESTIELRKLRSNCPCATCLAEKENYGKNYIPVYSKDQVSVKNINSVGSYAIGITWNDGHNTGIYDFQYLYNISSKDFSLESG